MTAELRQAVGARIDKINQPSRETVLLQLRGPAGSWRLLLDANTGHPRLHFTTESFENPAVPPMFCMLLRKHLTGGRLLELFQRVSEEFNARRMGYRDVIGSLLFQIAMEYERHISVRPSEDAVAARINQRAEEIMLFINGNLTRNITTNDVADTLHLSKRQNNRIVLKEFGTSCNNVIRQTKHKKAQELLLYSDKSIQDIASLLGYSNVYSFSKFFKSEEGLPPALFRRSHYSY